jgi:hypothetical protein
MKRSMLVFIFLLGACTRYGQSPEGIIQNYINEISKEVRDFNKISKMLTGDSLSRFEAMSDEEKTEALNLDGLKGFRLKIAKKNCPSESECFVTYTLSYTSESPEIGEYKTEVRKVAKVKLINENWKIDSVTNIKTFHQSLKALDILESKDQ